MLKLVLSIRRTNMNTSFKGRCSMSAANASIKKSMMNKQLLFHIFPSEFRIAFAIGFQQDDILYRIQTGKQYKK